MKSQKLIIDAALAQAIAAYLNDRPRSFAEVEPLINGLRQLQPLPSPAQEKKINGSGHEEITSASA